MQKKHNWRIFTTTKQTSHDVNNSTAAWCFSTNYNQQFLPFLHNSSSSSRRRSSSSSSSSGEMVKKWRREQRRKTWRTSTNALRHRPTISYWTNVEFAHLRSLSKTKQPKLVHLFANSCWHLDKFVHCNPLQCTAIRCNLFPTSRYSIINYQLSIINYQLWNGNNSCRQNLTHSD